MNRKVLCSLLLTSVLLVSAAEARKTTRLPALEWGMRVGVTGIYNDNVLRLSDPDQNAFRRRDPAFRTELQTIDDGETELTLTPSIQWRAPANMMMNGIYRFKSVQRVKNDFTNYQTHSLTASVRPRTKGYRWTAKVSAFTIPSFYLRVYRDRDFGTYEDARFKNWEYSGEFAVRPAASLWIAAQAGYGSVYYGEKFTEFDTESIEFGPEIRYATPWQPILTLRYARRLNENVGKDQSFSAVPSFESDEVLEDNEYGDGDSHEDEFRAQIRTPLHIGSDVVLDAALSSRFRRRVYTTDRSLEIDPFHRGRLDNRWEITPTLSWAVNSALDLDAIFVYEQRVSRSDIEGVPRVKNFDRREFGLGLTYKIN